MGCLAIICDLIKSKSIPNRTTFQKHLQYALDLINKKYESIILSNFTITTGDEFQGVFNVSKSIFKMIDELELLIKHPFRVGIGYGSLLTDVKKELSIGADGKAFWNARNAITLVHDYSHSLQCNIHFIGGKAIDSTINTLLCTSEALKDQWTPKQLETFRFLISNDIFTDVFNQLEVAKSMNISASSLSKRLSTGHIKIYLKARIELGSLLECHYENAGFNPHSNNHFSSKENIG